jgi:hypothetical protein
VAARFYQLNLEDGPLPHRATPQGDEEAPLREMLEVRVEGADQGAPFQALPPVEAAAKDTAGRGAEGHVARKSDESVYYRSTKELASYRRNRRRKETRVCGSAAGPSAWANIRTTIALTPTGHWQGTEPFQHS